MPAVVVDAGLAGDKPWVPVDRATLETANPDVFAVGDVNVIPVGEAAVPKAGVFAAGEGRTVARVIASRVLGTRPPDPYDGVGLASSRSQGPNRHRWAVTSSPMAARR